MTKEFIGFVGYSVSGFSPSPLQLHGAVFLLAAGLRQLFYGTKQSPGYFENSREAIAKKRVEWLGWKLYPCYILPIITG